MIVELRDGAAASSQLIGVGSMTTPSLELKTKVASSAVPVILDERAGVRLVVRRVSRHGVRPSCVVLPAGPWLTIVDFLCSRFPTVSREEWFARISRGEVTSDSGASVAATTAYAPQQKIHYYRRVANEPRIPLEARVLFQDEHIVVADKPHFLPVVPSGRFARETLLARLIEAIGIETLAPMHRIDRDTAGLVLFTVQPSTRDAYQRLFRERVVAKHYEAIAPFAANVVLPRMLQSRLIESDRFMQMREVSGAVNAETHLSLIERRGDLARYALRPLTGQKHQLRAQLSALGMPIVNDRIYPVLQPAESVDDWTRPLKLLAKRVTFIDPISGICRDFTSAQTLDWP